MKKFIIITLVLLPLLVSTVEPQMNAQNNDQLDREESRRIIKECLEPDRPKPEVQTQMPHPVLCGKASSLPKPPYPEEAKAQKVSGVVRINIVIDEKGRVIWAEVAEGHLLLREASRKAACQARYSPLTVSKQAVKASGMISYSFVNE